MYKIASRGPFSLLHSNVCCFRPAGVRRFHGSSKARTPYPGLGMPLRYHGQLKDEIGQDLRVYPIGVHTNSWGSESDMLLTREVAMMIVMDRIMDKPDFHVKVFNDDIAKRWSEEALEFPVDKLYGDILPGSSDYLKLPKTILDKECMDYCIKEVREKAAFFKKTGLIPTLDANASVIKSDTFIDESLHFALRDAFLKLKEQTENDPDWHPRTNEIVRDIVHPSMYPLVYGRSRVLPDEVVGLEDAVHKWAGKGDIIPQADTTLDVRREMDYCEGGSMILPSFWSSRYQWLPSNLKVQESGRVELTSYINNINPVKHRDVYNAIERLIDRAIPAWDLCLTEYRNYRHVGNGRMAPRFPKPYDPRDENPNNWTPPLDAFKKSPSLDINEKTQTDRTCEEDEYYDETDEQGNYYYGTREEIEWQKAREPAQPKAPEFHPFNYGVKPGTSLRDQFEDLQVIIKIASIELTPDKPEFPQGNWHVEGQMNEHIVATALYYLDSHNITPSRLDFRMQTSSYQDEFNASQEFTWMESVYGTKLDSGGGGPCVQRYGSVETKQGRLLAFPNVFHHRVSGFKLKDKSKPGHRRFIALWLVDPLTRIISTANVPPQQQSWWMERLPNSGSEPSASQASKTIGETILEQLVDKVDLEAVVQGKQEIPAELSHIMEKEFGDAIPMSSKEAERHRIELIDARTVFQEDVRGGWESVAYSFCEH